MGTMCNFPLWWRTLLIFASVSSLFFVVQHNEHSGMNIWIERSVIHILNGHVKRIHHKRLAMAKLYYRQESKCCKAKIDLLANVLAQKWSTSSSNERLSLLDSKCLENIKTAQEGSPPQYNTAYADRKLRYFYCAVHKVATTSILRSLALASGAPEDLKHKVHWPTADRFLKRFKSFSPGEQRLILRDNFKFMFVRHPFERLVSAYIDKFLLTHLDTFPVEFIKIASNIKEKYRAPKARKDDKITFAEFVRYIIDPKTRKPFDIHWRPYSELCQPCSVNYDFIGHYETLREDVNFVLKKLKLHESIRLPNDWRGDRNSSQFVRPYFASLPPAHLRALRDIYRADFILFGYDWNIV